MYTTCIPLSWWWGKASNCRQLVKFAHAAGRCPPPSFGWAKDGAMDGNSCVSLSLSALVTQREKQSVNKASSILFGRVHICILKWTLGYAMLSSSSPPILSPNCSAHIRHHEIMSKVRDFSRHSPRPSVYTHHPRTCIPLVTHCCSPKCRFPGSSPLFLGRNN